MSPTPPKGNPSSFEIEPTSQQNHIEEEEEEELVWCSSEERKILQSQGIVDDFFLALQGVKFIAPFVALLAFFLAYHLTIAPYRVTVDDVTLMQPEDIDLAKLRPILSDAQMSIIQKTLLYAETEFYLPPPSYASIHVKFHPASGKRGTHRLPAMFYEGVTFGIGVDNPHNLTYTAQNTLSKGQLKYDLKHLPTPPTFILDRQAKYNGTFTSTGYAAYFSYKDLEAAGRLSSDVLQPYKRIVDDVVEVARKYKQAYVVLWYPHDFGTEETHANALETSYVGHGRALGQKMRLKDREKVEDKATTLVPNEDNTITVHSHQTYREKMQHPYRFKTIVQSVVPTRTGLDGIKVTAAVSVSLINGTEPFNLFDKLAHNW